MIIESRIAEAAVLARRLIKADPKAPLPRLTLAAEDIKKGRFATAGARFGTMPGKSFLNFLAPVLRAWSLVGEKKPEAALEVLTAEAKDEAAKAMHAMHAALIHEMAGNNDEAEKYYLKVSDGQNGLSLRVAQLLGSFYERTARPEKARTLYDRYLKEQPGSQFLNMALTRLEEGKKPRLRVFSVSDGAAEAFFSVASSLRQQSGREIALVLSRLALYLKPKFPVMQILLADLLEADDRLEPALGVYRSIDGKSAFSWSARLRMASILNRLKRTDEAVKHLNGMTRDRKDVPGPLINLGDILRSHDRFSEAVDAYDKAFSRIDNLEERHWTLLYARGISLERSDQWPRSEADFLRALELKPEQPYVLNYLGYSWIDKGMNIDRAQDMIRRAVKLRPNDGYIVDSLGWGYYRLGNFKKAVRHLERAAELRPQDPIINDHLGDAYWWVGRTREAKFQWNRSLSLDPEDDLIAKIRQKMKTGLAEDTETAKNSPDDG
jgi:tetratricopeptide (TPR) repeat protein